jgi:hypothetical protein
MTNNAKSYLMRYAIQLEIGKSEDGGYDPHGNITNLDHEF